MAKMIYFLELKRPTKKLYHFTSGNVEKIKGEVNAFYHCFTVELDTLYLTGEHEEIKLSDVKRLIPIDDEFVNRFKGVKAIRFKYVYETLKRNL